MASTNIREDLKSVLERIGGMCFKAEAILKLCMDGFIKHKVGLIDEAKKMSLTIRNEGTELRKLLDAKATESGNDKETIKSLMSIVNSIEMANTGLDSTLQHVRFKVSEGILFSDKAVNEVSHLFKETLDILKTAGDVIVTKNEVLKKYIVDKYNDLNEIVERYSVEHEERLIKGVCQPQASLVYLNIVDSLITAVWHIKQALIRLFENSGNR